MHPENLVEVRTEVLEPNIGDKWIWPITDTGAWDGPILNWHAAHGTDYFTSVKNYDVVITAGANCGLHTRVYASKFKHVYAFEPHWLNFYCLTRNCPQQHVYKFNAALGNLPGIVNLSDGYNENMGCYTINGDAKTPIPVMRIDDLGVQACDLIQLDVEGYEGEVLEGALKTIEKYKPVIALETVNHRVMAVLDNFGYKKQTPYHGGDSVFHI